MWKTIKSFITGVLAGTAMGVIFAPKKGEETRQKFKDEVEDGGYGFSTLKETLNEMGRDMEDTAHDVYDDVSETELYKKGAEKVKEAKKKAGKAIKKNIPAKHRKTAKSALKKAKKTIQKVKDRFSNE